ncbi:unnamed protein product [Didymodactylos carnosus]|uniref:Uncharacterized protein n=1 Tax=Didymodactylos carnosus TaxID=1234261 RepID=A0A814AEY8_9BILA|nr:unnamed protein product [Didymodactylos carnosus]CAF1059662.1 unnamed protein product [Didymodactylos carnosus]CAF3694430.1 unnamed protein product [Didymodactylos carnosus]CAF3825364.1 unnamed protein product [Didymodactylos carnosus]
MGNTWQTIKQWKIKPDELISVIRFSSNNNYVGLAVQAQSRNWHFEPRNRQTTDVIWTIQLDNHDRRRFPIPLQTEEWLIVHNLKKLITQIDKNGQVKRTIKYPEVLRNAVLIEQQQCLIIATDKKQLHFYDL